MQDRAWQTGRAGDTEADKRHFCNIPFVASPQGVSYPGIAYCNVGKGGTDPGDENIGGGDPRRLVQKPPLSISFDDDDDRFSRFSMMMMTFITRRGEGQGRTKKERKATKSKGRGLEEGASRALMRLEVEVNSKRRSPGHDVSNLVLETVEESCAFGEDIVLVGLR